MSFLLAFSSSHLSGYPILPHFISFDPPMLFFILVFHDPLSFLILGFSNSPQLFILASHFFQTGCQGLDLLCSLFSIHPMLWGSLLSLKEDGFEWSAFPTNNTKLMMRKITKLRTSSHCMDDPVVGHVSGANMQESLGKKCNTLVWCLPKTL